MSGSIVQVKAVAQNTATSPASITLDNPVAAGNRLVVVYGGDAYVPSGNRPSGFLEPTGGRQETFLGHYAWHKQAAGGEQAFSCTPGSPVPWCMIAMELAGVGELDVSNGTLNASGAPTMTSPAVTPGAGARFGVATFGASLNSAFNPGLGAWTDSYVEQADVATVLASGTRDNIGVGTRSFTADGVTAYSAGVTWDGAVSPQSRTGILLVFQEAVSGSSWSQGYDVLI